jgi:hypothetical protein
MQLANDISGLTGCNSIFRHHAPTLGTVQVAQQIVQVLKQVRELKVRVRVLKVQMNHSLVKWF